MDKETAIALADHLSAYIRATVNHMWHAPTHEANFLIERQRLIAFLIDPDSAAPSPSLTGKHGTDGAA